MNGNRIVQLDEVVTNRIAAGEVILKPVNAVKELLENCLDAGATEISVIAKNGGMKFLSIQDNGCGICKEDLSIVTKRFTTSKLTKFEDLRKISTFGFRGEALASISYVSRLRIISRTKDSKCAYQAKYLNSNLISDNSENDKVMAMAGCIGTTIIVEDLFYNVSTRKKTIKNFNLEYRKIVGVISRYAIHNDGVSFSLRKNEKSIPDVHTQKKSKVLDRIRLLYGHDVSREVLHVKHEAELPFHFTLEGYVCNANYRQPKSTFILFVNNRLVESSTFKKAIEEIYKNYLPKNLKPWVYLSLKVDPINLDVNMHPTKREVRLFHEKKIIDLTQEILEEKLTQSDESRSFFTQQCLNIDFVPKDSSSSRPKKISKDSDNHFCDLEDKKGKQNESSDFNLSSSSSPTPSSLSIKEKSPNNNNNYCNNNNNNQSQSQKKLYSNPSKLVRTDSRLKTLDTFVYSIKKAKINHIFKDNPDNFENFENFDNFENDDDNEKEKEKKKEEEKKKRKKEEEIRIFCLSDNVRVESSSPYDAYDSGYNSSFVKKLENTRIIASTPCTNLTSLKIILDSFENLKSKELEMLFADFSFVGCVDKSKALIQHATGLFLCDSYQICKELLFQRIFVCFSKLTRLKMNHDLPLKELISLYCESSSFPEYCSSGLGHISRMSPMLMEYFSLGIVPDKVTQEPVLKYLPQIIPGLIPDMSYLPEFFLCLATKVRWETEIECLEDIAFHLADFFSRQFDPKNDRFESKSEAHCEQWGMRKKFIKYNIYGLASEMLKPSQTLALSGAVCKLTNLEKLYKVFERC